MSHMKHPGLFGSAFSDWCGRRSAFWAVAVLALGVAGAGMLIFGAPVPFISDEFANLFAGETFSHLRLSYPSPPSPESFWSPHILVEPRFASKYPPGQGLLLGLGYIFGEPSIGLIIGAVICALSLFWTLRGFTSADVAFVVTCGFIVSVLYLSDWTRTFMGGMVAFSASALVIGSVLRISKAQGNWLSFLALGFGIGWLMLSRPFEGGIVVLLLGIFYSRDLLRFCSLRNRKDLLTATTLVALPICAAIIFQGSINQAVTGSYLRLPHAEFHAQYMNLPVLTWQDPIPARKSDTRLSAVENILWNSGSWIEHVAASIRGSLTAAKAIGGPALPWLIILSLPFICLKNWRLVAVLAGFPMFHAFSNYLDFHPYFSPVAPIWYLMVASMLFELCRHTRFLAIKCAYVLLLLGALGIPRFIEDSAPHRFTHRTDLIKGLAARAPSLVFVSYAAELNPHLNVVYNEPQLKSPIIFVNDLDEVANCQVLRAFPDRETWRVMIEERRFDAVLVERESICTSAALGAST